jgi:hypothetical protein
MRSNNQKLVNSRQNLNQFEADMRVDESLIAVKRELHCMKTTRCKIVEEHEIEQKSWKLQPIRGNNICNYNIYISGLCMHELQSKHACVTPKLTYTQKYLDLC